MNFRNTQLSSLRKSSADSPFESPKCTNQVACESRDQTNSPSDKLTRSGRPSYDVFGREALGRLHRNGVSICSAHFVRIRRNRRSVGARSRSNPLEAPEKGATDHECEDLERGAQSPDGLLPVQLRLRCLATACGAQGHTHFQRKWWLSHQTDNARCASGASPRLTPHSRAVVLPCLGGTVARRPRGSPAPSRSCQDRTCRRGIYLSLHDSPMIHGGASHRRDDLR